MSEYIQLMPGIRCIPLSAGEVERSVALEINAGSGFSLVWIQPSSLDQGPLFSLLRHPSLQQLIVIRAGRLGRKILPEWNTPFGYRLLGSSQIRQRLNADKDWSCREVAIGNLNSLLWGFASARLLALNRPDLADRCNARMRHHLFPEAAQRGTAYLSLISVARVDLDKGDSGDDRIASSGGR